MKGLIFNCEASLLETEDLERAAYNATFDHFNVLTKGHVFPVDWTEDEFALLRNKIVHEATIVTPAVAAGGSSSGSSSSNGSSNGSSSGAVRSPNEVSTALIRQYFKQSGWPTSDISPTAPANPQEQTELIDTLASYQRQTFEDMVSDGDLEARPGVLRVLDEARAAGIKVGVCAVGAKLQARPAIKAALGDERYESLTAILTEEDMPGGAPGRQAGSGTAATSAAYRATAQRMGLQPEECVVVEGCVEGLKSARAAGMRCIITYTPTTKAQLFPGAERIVSALGFPANITVKELQEKRIVQDDRWEMTVTDAGLYFHAPDEKL